MKDSELLRRFVQDHDQGAFAELVRLHVNFVYAAALRHVSGDCHRAEDVAQQVFVDLARKAPDLGRHPCLPGWLYASTRFTAINILRHEQRRTNREKDAEIMHESSDAQEPHWEQIRPLIDDAMQELDERDRQSVLLRFFGRQTFGAIGEQLGLSENAAQKRVERALDRLAAVLAQRGITSTSAALSVALAQAGVAAPASLAGSATTVALATARAGGSASTVTFLRVAKLLAALGAAAACGFVGGVWHQTSLADRQTEQREAEFDFRLSGLQARVRTESKRADLAEADTARLLSAIDQARAERAALAAISPKPTPPSVPNPVPADPAYTIMPGDTAAKIATQRGLTLDQLQALNPNTNWARLRVGQQIRLQ